MNIDLIYQGKSYNFDLRKDSNIKYIQGLASKLIGKDSSTFDLFYKNICFSDYEDTILIKDLVENDNNISILIIEKGKKNLLSIDKKLKLKKKIDLDQSNNTANINNLKIMLNSPLTSPINSKNKNTNQKLNISQNKINKKSEYLSENKVFEDVYNLKENEILSLLNDLSQKIKEYDDVLYKKFKNNNKSNNNELSLYEKNIIDFKDKQINFLKKLIDYFDENEKDFLLGVLTLNEFYNDLKQYNNPKIIIVNNKSDLNRSRVINVINNKNNMKIISKNKSKFEGRNINEDKTLPLLLNNKSKNKYFTSQNNNIINSDDSDENNNNNYEGDKNLFKAHKFNNDKKNITNKNISLYKKNLNKTENKEKNIKTENNLEDQNNNNNNKKIKNIHNYYNALSLCNTNDNTNTSQNTTIQGKIAKKNIMANKNLSKKNTLNTQKSIKLSQKINTIINSKNKNRINALFEDFEINQDKNSNGSINSNTSRRRFSKDSYNNENEYHKKLSRIGEESSCSLRKTKQSKKEKSKKKKLRNNIYDFLI